MTPDSLSHRQTWDLLPWLINRTATPAEREAAETHLLGCADCRDEYAFQSRIRAGLDVDSGPDADSRVGWQRLLARMDAADVEPEIARRIDAGGRTDGGRPTALPGAKRRWLGGSRRPTRWLGAIASLQAVALVALATFVVSGRDPSASYRTLSLQHDPGATAAIRFVPSPALTVGEMQALFADAGVSIVSSNRDNSIYGLTLAAASPGKSRSTDVAMAIAKLRAARGALLVEPVVGDADGPH